MAISRSLVKINEDFKKPLKDKKYLTRDAREVERKKFGKPKARKSFQFSKR
jgi:small subunit ribosomal protein S9